MSAPEILGLAERVAIGQYAGESHFREFKSALSRDEGVTSEPRDIKAICRDIGETLVSFANADGGELFVGLEDDGAVTGVPHKDPLVAMMKGAFEQYVHVDTPLSSPLTARTSLLKIGVASPFIDLGSMTPWRKLFWPGWRIKPFSIPSR